MASEATTAEKVAARLLGYQVNQRVRVLDSPAAPGFAVNGYEGVVLKQVLGRDDMYWVRFIPEGTYAIPSSMLELI
jgi:hypothetical protein